MSISYPDRPADHNPMFSVIVPAYNVAGYIDRCLASLLEQEAANIEIIVVDDGSTDDTYNTAARWASDTRVRLIRQANAGPGGARNTGLDAACGRYITFVDPDDWVEDDYFATLSDALAAHPKSDLLVFGFYEVYGRQRTARRCRADFWDITDSSCNKLYRRDLFATARYDLGLWYEDLALIPYIYALASHPVGIDHVLYNYQRDRQSSTMNSVEIERLMHLPRAANRCVERIQVDEVSGHMRPMAPRFGNDWLERFYTIEIFIPGVLHRSRRINDRAERTRYIAAMLRQLPNRQSIRVDVVRAGYGRKMALGSRLYRQGHDELAHLLLHDIGRAKRGLFRRLGLSVADPG